MPKLYLHAGTHKTGTTGLQTFAAQNQGRLASQGILYPGYSPLSLKVKDGHHQFAHSIARTGNARLSPDDLWHVVRSWHQKAASEGLDVLVSSEALYRHLAGEGTFFERRRNYLSRVSTFLEGFDVRPLLVFRRPDDFIRSLYQEHILSHSRLEPMPDFLGWAKSKKRYQLSYYESACLFKEVFGSLGAWVYEDLAADGNLYQNFFSVIGVDSSGFVDPGRVRASLTVPEAVVMNYAKGSLKDGGAIRGFVSWLRSPAVSDRIHSAFGGKRFDFWGSYEEREEFIRSRSGDVEALRSEFFVDRESLFPALKASETLPPIPEIPAEIVRIVDRKVRKLNGQSSFWGAIGTRFFAGGSRRERGSRGR